jgi:hypothetical protein
MTITTTAAPNPGMRTFLTVFATIELVSALIAFPALFVAQEPAAGPEFARQVANGYVVLRPLLAFGAFVPATLGRPRQAIVFLALLVLAGWLPDLAYLFLSDLEVDPGLLFLPRVVAYPVIAVAVLWLVWRNTNLWLAAILAVLPIVVRVIGLIVVSASVLLWGF